MNMSASDRVQAKVSSLAREYKSKGYRVLVEPTRKDMPAFLKKLNFTPDIIAKSKNRNLIFEVKSRESIGDAKNIAGIARIVNEQKNWEFVFVYTNSRQRSFRTVSIEQQDREAIRKTLEETNIFLKQNISDRSARNAGFLLL